MIRKITGQIVVVVNKTRKGLEDYRLQELADPFRIEREPDLRKEQEEYFTRIRQGFVDPGSYV